MHVTPATKETAVGKRESYEPGTFCWVELATTDPGGAKAFYGELFGWEAEDMPVGEEMTYTVQRLGGDDICGLYELPADQREQGVPPYWHTLVSVESADAAAEKARSLDSGGALIEPFDVLDAGRMAVIQDPAGAVFSAWQPRAHVGATRVNDVGCLAWNELNTREPEIVSGFYSALFGWELERMEEDGELAYAVIQNNGWPNGGIMPMTEQHGDAPPFWLPYFTVSSCDGVAARVRELGGTVLAEPFEPGAGRISVLSDLQGAAFAVFEGETDE